MLGVRTFNTKQNIVHSAGVMLAGGGGNNGGTVMTKFLANKSNLLWIAN